VGVLETESADVGVLEAQSADAQGRAGGSTQGFQQTVAPWFATPYLVQGLLQPQVRIDVTASSFTPARNGMRDILFVQRGEGLPGGELPVMEASRGATLIALVDEPAGIHPAHGHPIDAFQANPAGWKSAVTAKRPQGSDFPEHDLSTGWTAEDAAAGLCLAALLASGPEMFKLNLADQFFATLPRTRNRDAREPWSAPDPLRRPGHDGTECGQTG
jgi:hypothetical protein